MQWWLKNIIWSSSRYIHLDLTHTKSELKKVKQVINFKSQEVFTIQLHFFILWSMHHFSFQLHQEWRRLTTVLNFFSFLVLPHFIFNELPLLFALTKLQLFCSVLILFYFIFSFSSSSLIIVLLVCILIKKKQSFSAVNSRWRWLETDVGHLEISREIVILMTDNRSSFKTLKWIFFQHFLFARRWVELSEVLVLKINKKW